ncbi:MAG: TetR/AcrR family transcriptional regulator [Clostridia bacterium]|nr:TetR/AcrR family transcriptional regulator [Clostridia bacterium]
MARIDKGALTKIGIIGEATKQFLENGYSNTTVSSIAKGLEMSPGNLTFHYPTKEHLLAELVDMLCKFQWEMMETEANEGVSSVMAICLELTTMLSASEDDEVIKDFFISSYSSPLCLDHIRRNDAQRAKNVFGAYRPDWTDEQFAEAEMLVSGIEYATLMTAGDPVSLEARITGALTNILTIYGIPEETRSIKLKKVFAMDYRTLGRRVRESFKQYVVEANEKAFRELVGR